MSKSLHSEFILSSTVPVGVLLALWHLLTHPLECSINIFMSYAKLTLSHCHLQVFLPPPHIFLKLTMLEEKANDNLSI